MKKTKIKDIYKGEGLYVWEDGEFVTLAFGLTTIGIPYKDGIWDRVKEDIEGLVKAMEDRI